MSAPDFYFVVNSTARHIHDEYGKEVLVDYWRSLGREYYGQRAGKWREGGLPAIADDWRQYFLHEPGAVVETTVEADAAHLDVRVCPAIKHLRESGRDIVPYFCEHCDHTCGSMAEQAGYQFARTGGMGSCHQTFYRPPATAEE
ncbi:MAG: hypothetical protein WD738_22375 [Pirellulales bacterium]